MCYVSHYFAFLRNCLDVATGTHYTVTGPELMHTNDCAAKVYLWVRRLSESRRYLYRIKLLL